MKKIVVLAGDGIGPEIMESALTILQVASEGQFDYKLKYEYIGGEGLDQVGDSCPPQTIASCQAADAVLLGAIGGPEWAEVEKTAEEGLLQLRKSLKLYANIRPIQLPATLADRSPLKREVVQDTDFIIVRELIGGLYFGRPKYQNGQEAFDTMYYSRHSIERIVRLAFELASRRGKKLCSVDKANVLANSRLWRQIVNEISADYPEVELDHLYVDADAMKIISSPAHFDVIVTENLFGDILSDEASVITASLGMMPSASLSEEGPDLYEPIHGSAPDIAGQDRANPMSMILSMTMMLRQSFGQNQLAGRIEAACQQVMAEGIMTADLGGQASCSTFTQAVVKQVKS